MMDMTAQLGDYRVLELIGLVGMGSACLAE